MRKLLLAAVCCSAVLAQTGVTGARYSAEKVVEHTQTLADGTHISQPATVTKIYRDSLGRTRTEQLGREDGRPYLFSQVTIVDPIAGYRYRLESSKQIAHRFAMSGHQGVQSYPGGPGPLQVSLPPPSGAAVTLQSGAEASSSNATQGLRPEITSESLGTRTMNGVIAWGRRTTTTLEVGAVGNDREIVVTHETWTSPELHITVLSTNHDPRSGDSTTRIENLSRAEPDPSLFLVPPNYDIVDDDVPVNAKTAR